MSIDWRYLADPGTFRSGRKREGALSCPYGARLGDQHPPERDSSQPDAPILPSGLEVNAVRPRPSAVAGPTGCLIGGRSQRYKSRSSTHLSYIRAGGWFPALNDYNLHLMGRSDTPLCPARIETDDVFHVLCDRTRVPRRAKPSRC